MVAKAYDPVYVDDDFYINPFLVSGKSYTYETAAYNALSDLQSLIITGHILLVLSKSQLGQVSD